MKKFFIAILAITLATPAFADGRHGYGHGGGRGWGWGDGWIVPAIIGGAVLYDLTRPQTVYVQPAPIYVQPETVYIQPAPAYSTGYGITSTPPSVPYWYYCAAANGYYPNVQTCPSGWQTVPAIPPATWSNAPYADQSR